ncbi:MAG TPA: MdtA/MuxA family multidrug efflux RND transporter periplasmic adaptor subunit [Bryobacteraceae bacterium]|nr:MdtA/MuxA family multidrug efflux RND transporter periplasmic adaptor subunit [Bryobacteraceae bacterium]
MWPRITGTKSGGATGGAAGKARSRGPQATPVIAAKAHKGDVGVYLTGLGAVTPIYTVTVKSRVDGQLMRIHYSEGDLVHKDDVLAEIDPRPYQVQLEQAEGQQAKDQATLANARTDLARYQTLLTQNAIPEQQVATQKATVTQDEGTVKSDQGLIDSAKLNLDYCRITAPITGRVGLRLVDPGNIVHASDQTGLLVITQIDPISVIFTIAEDQLPAVFKRLRAGQRLGVDAYNHDMTAKIAHGWLTTIDNQIDPSTATVKLRATFDNKDDALFPNQFVNARLLVEQKRNVTLVPTSAVQRNSQTTYVYLVKPDSTVTVRPVTIGTTEGDDSEVTAGLEPGDVVVMTGVDKLQEGSKVNVHFEGESPATGGRAVSGAKSRSSLAPAGKTGHQPVR